MGPYHFIVGSLMEPDDDFIQRLRKNTTALFFIPGAPTALLYVIVSVLALDGSQYSINRFLQNLTQALCCSGAYLWMRRTRHVGGAQAAFLCWMLVLSSTPSFLNVPDIANTQWAILGALLAVFLRIPFLPPFLGTCFIYALLAEWNRAHVAKDPGSMWVLPGYITKSALDVFIEGFIVLGFISVGIVTFIAVITESERRARAQKAANQMTLEILQLQRRYDTTKITEVIEECKTAGVVDAELLTLFANMNSNLESYRPFLPNYLFNEADSDVEAEDAAAGGEDSVHSRQNYCAEDDEGSIPVLGSGSNYQSPHGCVSAESSTGGSSTAGGDPRPTEMTKRADLYNGRVTFALVDVNAERLAPSDFGGKTSDVLKSVVHMIYTLAKETKASVHSMLGDTVQLTWNATQNVVLPETKGAVFLARLAKHFKDHTSPDISLSAAVCSGRAAVHSFTTNNQQALLIEAAWLPILEACFDLAKQVGWKERSACTPSTCVLASSVVLMDDRTAKACHLEVEAEAVEVVEYLDLEEPRRPTFLGHYAPNMGISRSISAGSSISSIRPALPRCNSSRNANLAAASTAVVHQLIREHQRADDEWMYQIQHGPLADQDDDQVNSARVHLKALLLASEGRGSAALEALGGSGVNSLDGSAASDVFLQALCAQCRKES